MTSKSFLVGLGGALVVIGGYFMFRTTEQSLRALVVQAASNEVGLSVANKYWSNVLPNTKQYPPSWCGAFVLWALHQAGLAKEINWIIGTGFLYRLPQTHTPKVGDIAYFATNQHHAIVSSVDDDMVSLINGNGEGGKVSVSTAGKSRVTAFYSIQPLIDQVLNA